MKPNVEVLFSYPKPEPWKPSGGIPVWSNVWSIVIGPNLVPISESLDLFSNKNIFHANITINKRQKTQSTTH